MKKNTTHLFLLAFVFMVFAWQPKTISAQTGAIYRCGGNIPFSNSVPRGAVCDCPGTDWVSYRQLGGLVRGVCCGWVKPGTIADQCLNDQESETTAFCGETYPSSGDGNKRCICGGGGGASVMNNGQTCCGWIINGQCSSTDVSVRDIEVDSETLNSVNPLQFSSASNDLRTPGGIISRALTGFIFPIAGIILFVQLLLGGFQMLTGATSKGMEEGKGKITAALIGFLLLFASYWMMQLLELIFGLRILS